MRKIILLDDVFPTGEQSQQPVLAVHGGRQDFSRITKTASEALDYVKNVLPEPGKTHMLVLALGGEESWGPNRNGDGFPARPVAAKKGGGFWVEPGEELTKHYKTFETGHCYQHHVNKDPEKASGNVKKAFWNDKMQRVELLIVVDNLKDPEWVQRVNDGEFPAVSMGTRIKYDVCSQCGNKAPTRAHYCFPPGTKITMADGSRRPIESIVVGDLVLDACGKQTTVTELAQQNISECLVEFRSSISGATLRATKDHPIFSSPREAYVCYYRTGQASVRSCFPGAFEQCNGCQRVEPEAQTVAANALRVDDSVYAPALLGTGTTVMSKDLAYVIGLFMAEGSYAKQGGERNSVQFSIHEDETPLICAIQGLAATFGREAKTYTRKGSKGISVRIHARDVADLMFHHCGEYAHTKKASREIIDLPDDVLHEYIRGLWDGDGHIAADKRNYSRLNTASEDLAWQTAGLLRRLGYLSYVGLAMVPGGPTSRTNKFAQWYVATDYGCAERRTNTALVATRQLGHIKDVQHVTYSGAVYNFKTEAHTYVAEGLAVHNCDHVKFGMNQLNPDGTKNYVHNPSPNFFDISRVFRPADRTGYTLKKVAYASPYELYSGAEMGDLADDLEDKSAQIRKLSDIDKIIRGVPVASSSNLSHDESRVIQKFRDYASPKLAIAEIPREVLAAYSPAEVFATAADSGLTLTASEFLGYLIPKLAGDNNVRVSDDVVRAVTAAQHHVFDLFAQSPTFFGKVAASGLFDGRVNPSLRDSLRQYSEKRATIAGMLSRVVPEGIGLRPMEAPTTDLMSYTDPQSGRTYQTTRGAAIQTHDAIAKQQMLKMLGGSALLLGGYKALSMHPSLRNWKTPLALAAGGVGVTALRPNMGPQVGTDQGHAISRFTEFAPNTNERTAAFVLSQMFDYRGAVPASLRGESFLDKVAGVVDTLTGVDYDFDTVSAFLGNRLEF